MIAGAIAVEKFGLVQLDRDGNGPDCDVLVDETPNSTMVNAANQTEFQAVVKRLLDEKKNEDALTLIVASKITYWQTYVRKVYDLKFKNQSASEQISSDSATTDTHMIAHWGSTCFLLGKVGFKGTRKTITFRSDTGCEDENIRVPGRTC